MGDYENKKIKHKICLLFIWVFICVILWLIKNEGNMFRLLKDILPESFWSEDEDTSEKDAESMPEYKYFSDYINTDQTDYSYAEALSDSVRIVNTNEKNTLKPLESFNQLMNEKLLTYSYLTDNFYTIDSSTSITEEELNSSELLGMDLSIDLNSTDYKVLIYHTHGSECFSDSRNGVTEDTVIGVGDRLAELLEDEYGIAVYHDRTVYDMVDGTLDRSRAYDLARDGVQAILEEYPSIEVVIDLHRDGVNKNTSLVTEVDGKPMAQLMFLVGVSRLNSKGELEYLYNPVKEENIAFSLQLYLTAMANYDGLMRNIYVKGYRYNLDLAPRSLLVEVGGQTNTLEEARNSMEPLAAILYKVLSGE